MGTCGSGAGLPIQGSRDQNHWVAPKLTQNLLVKSKLPPRSGSNLEAVEPHP